MYLLITDYDESQSWALMQNIKKCICYPELGGPKKSSHVLRLY